MSTINLSTKRYIKLRQQTIPGTFQIVSGKFRLLNWVLLEHFKKATLGFLCVITSYHN